MRSAQYRSSALSRARCAPRSRGQATTASSAISSCPPSICRGACPARRCSSRTTSRPRSGGGMRRPRRAGCGKRLYRQQWRRMLRFEEPDAGPVRSGAGRVRCRSRDVAAALSAESRTTPISVIPTGVDTAYFAPAPAASGGRAAHRLHRVDGLAAERRRRAVLLPRDSAAHPAAEGRTWCSRSSDARRRPAVRRLAEATRDRGDGPRRGCPAVPGGVGGQRRAAAYRRRHAAQDLRSDGGGPRRRLDQRRRGGAADRERPAPAARRRSGRVRAIGRDAAARIAERRRRWSPRRVRSSPPATTGPAAAAHLEQALVDTGRRRSRGARPFH